MIRGSSLAGGATVSVVARGSTLRGSEARRPSAYHQRRDVASVHPVGEDPSKLGVQDYVIIAVKAPSLREVARQVSSLLGPETAVVTAMNGVPWWFFLNAKGMLAGHQLNSIDPGGTIGQAIPVRRVVGCVVHTAASVDEPGIIRHSSGRQLLVGEPDNRPTARLARLADWLCRAGFDCRELPISRATFGSNCGAISA